MGAITPNLSKRFVARLSIDNKNEVDWEIPDFIEIYSSGNARGITVSLGRNIWPDVNVVRKNCEW